MSSCGIIITFEVNTLINVNFTTDICSSYVAWVDLGSVHLRRETGNVL